ncbi:hypothetical protein G6O67_002218 [Ophiocordyceps sinensis]|uniref:Peptidase M13, neprilysin n=1 Tax=Ophiocordyceps sinensis TaxID=72228 RepID=A0A8H4PTV1_9HYPO|nr:hypothetical protein G6O67_002218 [Ophiocordyceps sinensis]
MDYSAFVQNVSIVLPRDEPTDKALFDSAKTSYQACMDESSVNAQGLTPLRNVVEQVTNKFPAEKPGCTTDKTGNQSISDLLFFMQELDITAFTGIEILPDPLDPDRMAFAIRPLIDPPDSPGIKKRDNTKTGPLRPAAETAKMLKELMPGNVSDEEARRLGPAVNDLTKALSDLIPPEDLKEDFQGATSMTLEAVAALSPLFGHDKVLKRFVPDVAAIGNVTVFFPDAIRRMSDLVSNTPRKVIQAFLVSQVDGALGKYVSDPSVRAPRKRQTGPYSSSMAPGMTYALDRPFLIAASVDKSTALVEGMMASIQEQFVQNLANNPWMSAGAKEQAENKTGRITSVMGTSQSSPNQNDVEDIAAYYAGLHMTSDYFANILSFRRWLTKLQFSRPGKPTDRRTLADEPSTQVSARYDRGGNQISILAGIMQSPFFHRDLPAHANFGGLGAVLGHELTHGFDDVGRKYDPSGRQATWWDDGTIAGFLERARCFVQQYSNFTAPTPEGEKPVDGDLTLGENIADAGGLRLAFDAWRRQRNASEPKISGLERFTAEQMFYISFAVHFCDNPSPETVASLLVKDVHAPEFARIMGTTANSRGFREAFDCPVKEPTCELF